MSKRRGFVNMSAPGMSVEDIDRRITAATRREVGRKSRVQDAYNQYTAVPFILLVVLGVVLTQFGDVIFTNTFLRPPTTEEEEKDK